MGRKYATVSVRSPDHTLEGLTALFDSGADVSVIGSEIADILGLERTPIEIKWHSSADEDEYSPITELEVRTAQDEEYLLLPGVLIDDRPIDFEAEEDMILGLDYLQKAQRILRFD